MQRMSKNPYIRLASPPFALSTPTLYDGPDLHSKQNEIEDMRQEIANLYTAVQVIDKSLSVAKSQVQDVMSSLLALSRTTTVFTKDLLLNPPSPASSAPYNDEDFLKSDE
jgi:hypothetical protein